MEQLMTKIALIPAVSALFILAAQPAIAQKGDGGKGSHVASVQRSHVHAAKAGKGTKGRSGAKGHAGTAPLPTTVQEELERNISLSSNIQGRLPAGTDVVMAASGFNTLGDFVATALVSQNLGISFEQLKGRVVTDGLTLGQGIHALKPGADSDREAQRAEEDARKLIAVSQTGTPTSKTKSGKSSAAAPKAQTTKPATGKAKTAKTTTKKSTTARLP
jgi:hypothetical protein